MQAWISILHQTGQLVQDRRKAQVKKLTPLERKKKNRTKQMIKKKMEGRTIIWVIKKIILIFLRWHVWP